ncbi:MAG: protein-glutamate O-methyltransferase CheR [Spirochaetaceae bacterium]|nr:MAG: protein-glutamate O-methyltransferase CheR [Spirochaetaceae bacterium]
MAKIEIPNFPELTDDTFNLFRRLIYQEMGINMRDSKKILVANRLRKRIVALKLGSYEEYYRLLTRSESAEEELGHFFDSISTNETYFYRGDNQFSALEKVILPELFKRRRRLHIWSAGSSSGEEPYTIYMVTAEAARSLHWSGEIAIVATDINQEVIASARQGEYGNRALRDLPQRYIDTYFKNLDGGRYRIKEDVKRHVLFNVHNLLKDEPPGKGFDVIFCRNVLIYFDRPTQRKLIDGKFAPALAADGYLFIGNSESLLGESKRFKYAQIFKSPIYRPVDARREENV